MDTSDTTHDRTQFLGDGQVRISFTADVELLGALQRCREVLRHDYPQGRLEDLISEALLTFLDIDDEDWEARTMGSLGNA